MRIGMFFLGILFGISLLFSGMANPQKVQNFLDLFGQWDASLAFVMGGGVIVTLIAFNWGKNKLVKPTLAEKFHTPSAIHIDSRLLIGSAIFGIGWGLVGVCPGPALVMVGMLRPEMLWFFGALLVGVLLFKWQNQR